MKTIICIFLVIIAIVSFGIWKVTSNTRFFLRQIRSAENSITALKTEYKGLDKYKDGQGIALDKLYIKAFNDIKEVSFYYHASSEIKVLGSQDLIATSEFFKPSQYKAVRYIDILCRTSLKDYHNAYLFEALYKIIKNKPIDILEVKIEKDSINLTMRLYGL